MSYFKFYHIDNHKLVEKDFFVSQITYNLIYEAYYSNIRHRVVDIICKNDENITRNNDAQNLSKEHIICFENNDIHTAIYELIIRNILYRISHELGLYIICLDAFIDEDNTFEAIKIKIFEKNFLFGYSRDIKEVQLL